MAIRKRRACVSLMLTPEERAALRAAADKADLSLTAFIRIIVTTAIRRGETVAAVARADI